MVCIRIAVALLIALTFVVTASTLAAQVVVYPAPVIALPPTPVTTYYAPAPAPVTTYYAPAPAPITTYYAPAPVTTYYAPAPVPVTAYYGAVPVAPVYGRPAILRTKVYYPGQPVRNFFKAVTW